MQYATIIATGSTHKVAKAEKGWITLFMGDGSTKAFREKQLLATEVRATVDPAVQEAFATASAATAVPQSPAVTTSPKKTRREASRTSREPRARKPISERRNGVIPATYLPQYQAYRRADGKQSVDNGDGVASHLRALSLDKVYAVVSIEVQESVASLKTRYEHLNPGMQRMNLGNKLRAHYRAMSGQDER